MDFQYQLYVADTETTGIDELKQEICELSIYHINQERQKTWYLKIDKPENVEPEALRINGHKLEDLTHKTAYGKGKYVESGKVLVDVENWMMEDMSSPEDKILIGHNVSFDHKFLEALWRKHNSFETFPFGNRPFIIDTRQIELFIALVEKKKNDYYNLGTLLKKYGLKNAKAHSAEADTYATKDLFLKQLAVFTK